VVPPQHFSTARVLTVEEALRMKEDRREKGTTGDAREGERAAALRGKIGFAKMI
jgi:hypothetical protein